MLSTALAAAQETARSREWLLSLEGFRMRLQWRSHNIQRFEAMPHVETRNLVSGYDGMRDESWAEECEGAGGTEHSESSAEADRLFLAWAHGKTGYPLVDACMRCLDATGWLTFRMRCLCVSFVCYHLWLDWRRPALYLAQRFLDFEPGIHFVRPPALPAVTRPAGRHPPYRPSRAH